MIAAAFATVLFAFSVTCGNRAARLVGGVEANFWRLIIATLLLGSWALTLGQGFRGPSLVLFLVGGALGIGLGDFGLFQALPLLGTRLTLVLTVCLTSPLGAALEWFWLDAGISVREGSLIVVILAGVGLCLWPERTDTIPRGHRIAGLLFGVLTAVGGALGAVYSRKAFAVAAEGGFDIDGPTSAFQRVVGGLAVTAVVFMVRAKLGPRRWAGGTQSSPVGRPWKRLIPWSSANALLGLTLGVSCMQVALKTTPAAIVLAIIATTPIVALPIARVMEGDRITPRSLAGSLMAVAGAAGLAWSRNA